MLLLTLTNYQCFAFGEILYPPSLRSHWVFMDGYNWFGQVPVSHLMTRLRLLIGEEQAPVPWLLEVRPLSCPQPTYTVSKEPLLPRFSKCPWTTSLPFLHPPCQPIKCSSSSILILLPVHTRIIEG